MKPTMKQLDIHSNIDTFDGNMEGLKIWTVIKEDVDDHNKMAHFLTFVSTEAYSLLNSL